MKASMPPEVIKAGIAMIPMGRTKKATDISHTYLFLAKPEAIFISGLTLHTKVGLFRCDKLTTLLFISTSFHYARLKYGSCLYANSRIHFYAFARD